MVCSGQPETGQPLRVILASLGGGCWTIYSFIRHPSHGSQTIGQVMWGQWEGCQPPSAGRPGRSRDYTSLKGSQMETSGLRRHQTSGKKNDLFMMSSKWCFMAISCEFIGNSLLKPLIKDSMWQEHYIRSQDSAIKVSQNCAFLIMA